MDESASPLALGDALSPRIITSPSKKIIDQRYALTHNCPVLNQLIDSKTICQLIDGMIMHAPYLGDLMRMMPDFLLTCLITPPDQCFTDVLARLDDTCAQARGDDAIMMALRLAKKQSALLIAMADIGGVWPLQKVT
jgi:glutamate-ammonia-ligase adenylyltransferase